MEAKRRLYLPEARNTTDEVILDGERAHYLTRVLRLSSGARIICFDGNGSEWQAELAATSRRFVQVSLGERLRQEPPPRTPLQLGIAWLKGSAMDTVMQKATELGVDAVWPIRTERSVVGLKPADDRVAGRLRHWQQVAISACEQSGRLFVPEIHEPMGLAELLSVRPSESMLMLDPGKPALPLALERESVCLLVGPEGGWTPSEATLGAGAGCRLFGLGDLVLRAETAPIAALSAVRHSWGWQR